MISQNEADEKWKTKEKMINSFKASIVKSMTGPQRHHLFCVTAGTHTHHGLC